MTDFPGRVLRPKEQDLDMIFSQSTLCRMGGRIAI